MARRSYPTDVTDDEWSLIEPLLPKPQRRGPRPNVNLREILNAIFYLLHEGCQWRALPNDFPPWQTVSSYFRKWQRKGIWSLVNHTLRTRLREAQGRNPHPSASSIDSQSVKTTQKRGRYMGLTAERKLRAVNDIF
jgi:transposase